MFNRILLVLLFQTVLSRDLDETERTARASFIQKLINRRKHLEGKLKLVGGANEFEGNVYIYHAGRWGAVCDDSWDHAAAQVVCSTYNKTGIPTHGGQFGEARRKYWMDDVVCEGNEESLAHCIFTGWGSSDCESNEAAGVICRDRKEEIPLPLKVEKRKLLHQVLDVRRTSLRLAGGRNSNEGRVEIYQHGFWGGICPDGWTLYEASAVCKHLALGYAEQALQTDYFGTSKIILSGVQCEGNETNLFTCKHSEFGEVVCPREKGHVAAVVCTQHLADLLLDTTAIERTAHLHDVPMYQLQCAMEENCLSKSAYEQITSSAEPV